MTNLEELAVRCEAATGPDHMIDYAIARLRDENGKVLRQDPFTASIDAAMTLVPEGWTAWELRSRQRLTRFSANVSRLVGDNDLDGPDDEEVAYGRGATPALALCAAALRARSTNGEK